MQNKKSHHRIEEITVKIIDSTLLIGSVIGLVAFLLGLFNYSESNLKVTHYVEFLTVASFIGIFIYRKQIPVEIKSVIILLGLFLIIIGDVIKLGVYSDSMVLVIVIPFYSFLVYKIRKTVIIYAFVVISIIFIGYLHLSGTISPGVDLLLRASKTNPWIMRVLLLSIVSFVVVVVMSRFSQAHMDFILDLEHSNKKITEQERNYREIFNSSTDAIFIHDLNGKILDVNNSMLKMYGYEKADLANLNIAELSSGKDIYTAVDAGEYVKKAIQGEPQVFDWQAKKKNGEYFWVEVALKKTNLADNDRVLAIIRDINDKKEDSLQLELYRNHLKELVAQKTKELEQTNEELHATNDNLAHQKEELVSAVEELQTTQDQLIQSEKMASLGVLAAGVAHEINNPLNFIQGGVFGLENYFDEELNDHKENVKPLLHAINVGVKRATGIVTSLNHYSTSQGSKMEECDIHKIIDSSLIMLHNKIKYKAEIKKDYTSANFILVGNEGQLHQVIVNLLLNAAQAINEKGIINVRTQINDHYLKLSIKDTGSGISKENLLKIFDPFFTTKEAGEGTGLGMSISLKIMEDHKGKIEYKSEINKGTEAIITLPLNN